ncbi:DUF4235 domain-containing protein [Streptomonospora nanhaiensis]|uniref:DUF4235 domain-containing protein n=1 Tax=Streptomonospora nanhaiensis TaxID=1323731 RepID=A0A853BEI7_9ACTN|nr:DUF4235 domain-containing protein [Streptomonospora nanhaiensis]MBV2366607.1 DUF4235 domain-containing protein [Streptomonospora nanhaiensis]MBX9388610.1 DUF4235 domain-containing protein [Streptomonospora nanhaiensis]NYI93838.1 hypothetical protein [Streptomonospora nanhaiensis]
MAKSKEGQGHLAAQIVGGVTALAAAYVARKVLTFAWTQATGKAPPTEPESPDVTLGEALGWAVVTGIGMEVTRVLAVRAAYRQFFDAGDQTGVVGIDID